MVSIRTKKHSNRTLHSQLDDFDHYIIFGSTMSGKQVNATANEGTADQEFTVGNSDSNPAVIESLVNVKTLERCFNEKIDSEMGNIVDTAEERIQNPILTASDSVITPKIELAFRSINASSGRDATSVMASSAHGEHIGITASFENVSERINTLHVFNTNDETRNDVPDAVSEMSVSGTQFDRQPHTHHTYFSFFSSRNCQTYHVHFEIPC